MAQTRVKAVTSCVLFALSVLVTLGAGTFQKQAAGETAVLDLGFPQQERQRAILIDLAAFSPPKRLVQPGRIRIRTDHQKGGLVNQSATPLWLKVKAEGLGKYVLSSNAPGFKAQSGQWTQPIAPGQSADLTILADLPGKALQRARVGEGQLVFTDWKRKQILSKVPIRIVNSDLAQ